MSPRAAVRARRAASIAAAIALCFVGLANHGLWTPDEGRVAEIGRAMLASGDVIVPRLGGRPFLETPPATWWPMLPGLALLGPTAAGARLPVGFACAATLLLVWDITRRAAGRRTAALAPLVMVTTGGVLWHAHRCVPDPWLMLAVTLALGCLCRALALSPAGPGATLRRRWVVAAYGAAGLCFLAKGLVGLALAGASGLALVLAARRARLFLLDGSHAPGLLLAAALVAAWPLALHARGEGALLERFVDESVTSRLTSAADGRNSVHHEGAWFYLLHAPVLLLPWALALPAAWRRLPGARGAPGLRALTAAFGGALALMSLPAAKRPIYLLPLLPALAPLVAAWLATAGRSRAALDRGTLALLLLALPALPCGALALALLVRAGVTFGQAWVVDLRGSLGVGALIGILATAGLALGATALGLRRLRAGSRRAGDVLLWGAALVAFATQALLYPALEPARGPGPVADFLRRACGDAPTFGFMLDETTVALAPFEAGVALESSWEPEELARFVRAHPGGRVLVFERMDDLIPADVRARLVLGERWSRSARRAYVVYAVRGP